MSQSELIECVELWENDSPIYGWRIKSIEALYDPIMDCLEHDPAYCNQCAEDEYR
jgi:hypothetical protein